MAGAVRWAGGNAAPSPQQRQHKSADVASTQQKLAMQNDARVQQYPALQRLIQTLPPNDDRSAFPLGLYSAASGSDVASIALQSGANISGEEMGRFQGALSSTAYPEFEDEDRMYPAGVMEDIQMEVLRRNNISMPCKKNQRIYGTVYAVDKKRVWVDVGHSGLAQLGRSELFVKDLLTEPGKARTPRLHAHDIRLGDRFVFRIQELKSPLGGIWLEPERKNRAGLTEAVWAELQKHYATQQPVGGRILNDVSKGFAVGIAGVVGLLHWDSISQDGVDPALCQKLGTLQPFTVTKVEPKYNELVVRFATGHRRATRSSTGRLQGDRRN